MIAGMLHPTSGEIIFQGHPWSRKDLSHIGTLIESPPLYENLTARENLKVRTTLLGLPDSRIEEVLETVDLTTTRKKQAGQFSMGTANWFQSQEVNSYEDFNALFKIRFL